MKLLPDPLRPFAAGRTWIRITIGESPADTFRLDRTGRPSLYLKVSPVRHRRDLLGEKERIASLGEVVIQGYLLRRSLTGARRLT